MLIKAEFHYRGTLKYGGEPCHCQSTLYTSSLTFFQLLWARRSTPASFSHTFSKLLTSPLKDFPAMRILRHSKRTWGKSYLCNSKWDKQLLLKASKAIFKSTYLSILKNERSENTWRGLGKNHNFAKRCKALHAQVEKENNLK